MNASVLRRTLRIMLIVLAFVGSGVGLREVSAGPVSTAPTCRSLTAAFAEQLEPLVEAMIDHRPATQPAVLTRASGWWKTHRARMPAAATVDSLMRDMRRATGQRRGYVVARLAHEASLVAFRACPDDAIDRQVAVLDHAGMAAWLAAQGEPTREPAEAAGATSMVAQRLRSAGRAGLADRLDAITRAAFEPHADATRAGRDAIALLDLVDEIERALARPVHPPKAG
ncbi:MAG: hypothetical protein ABI960_03990 [Candidatus Eisenbacteria bacterium]